MTQRFSESALNEAANGMTLNTIKLHNGDVGVNGTSNQIAGASAPATYGVAANGERDLSESVEVNVPADSVVSHYSVWDGTTFKYGNVLDSNPETFSNAGIAVIASAQVSFVNEVANE